MHMTAYNEGGSSLIHALRSPKITAQEAQQLHHIDIRRILSQSQRSPIPQGSQQPRRMRIFAHGEKEQMPKH